MVINEKAQILEDLPFFNAEFIRSNKIKKIEGTFMIFRSKHSIKQTEFVQGFDFSEEGELISQYENYPNDGSKDTAFIRYTYDDSNRLKSLSKNERYGIRTNSFLYDSLDRIIREEVSYQSYSNQEDSIINSEQIIFNGSTNPIRSKRLNSEGLPYKEVWCYKNSKGFIEKIVERYKRSSQNIETVYEYNTRDQLISKQVILVHQDKVLEHYEFEYNDKNELTLIKKLKDEEVLLEKQFIYEDSGLLASIMIEEKSTKTLSVIRFKKVEFYH